MIGVYLLIYIPILLFVVAFLYETYLSFARLFKKTSLAYTDATWEVTNTLLVFGVVMLMMLFTQEIDRLGAAIFLTTLSAGFALLLRGALYVYVFYIKETKRIGILDWLFAISHVVAALLLVLTVLRASIFLFTQHPIANVEFIPYFVPGLIVVLAISIFPLVRMYRTR
ncbi:MAG TPA: hypothetical protein VIM37_03225 [Candidatus Microsaccharimonas sp.]|jgi:cytochrome bd-type quinol oxidase subunit 2